MKHLRWPAFLVIIAGMLLSQLLIGGARTVFALPGYIAIAVGGLLLALSSTPPRGTMRQKIAVLGAILFALYVIVRSRFSPVEYVARPDLFMALAGLIVYGTAQYFRETRERMMLLFVLLGAAVVHVVVGVIQFQFSRDFMVLPGIMRPVITSFEWRASGLYIYPSHLAGLLEMIGLSALGLCCWARWKPWARLVAGHGAAICFGGVIITGSRGGYLSLFAGLLVFALLSVLILRRVYPERRGATIGAILAGVCGLLGVLYFFMADSAAIAHRLGRLFDASEGRPFLWYAALEQWHLAPILGTGSGSFLFFGRLFRSPAIQGDPIHVHCDYLELLAEYGLVGLAGGVIFLALHFTSGFSAFTQILATKLRPDAPPASNEMAILVGTLAALGALLFHSVIDFNLHLPANALVAAFFFGILASPRLSPGMDEPDCRRRKIGFAVTLGGPAIALLVMAISQWPSEFLGEKARVAIRDGRYQEARQLADRASAADRRNPDLCFYAGEAQYFLTQGTADQTELIFLYEGAASALERGLALSPRDTRLLLRYAQILDLRGRSAEAAAAYQQAIANDPNKASLHAFHGLFWQRRQQFWLAQCAFLKASALGETTISRRGFEQIARLKKNPLSRMASPDPFKAPRPSEPPAVSTELK